LHLTLGAGVRDDSTPLRRLPGNRLEIGAIAGYLLIGFTWTFAYQLLVQQVPNAIYFEPGTADAVAEQPSHLIYFSFITLTTVGYGDRTTSQPGD
jgi:voltage-gated potassium channel